MELATVDVLSVVLGAGAVFGASGTVFLWLETHGIRGKDRRREEIEHHLTTALAPVQSDLQGLHSKLDAGKEHEALLIKTAINEALDPMKGQLTELNTKIDPLWKALEAMAVAQVQVLHQPDPARARIDRLLEALKTEIDGGPLMPDEDYVKLRGYLIQIKTWEPGQDLGFPVLAGEPTSAGILLSIMGLTRERCKREREGR